MTLFLGRLWSPMKNVSLEKGCATGLLIQKRSNNFQGEQITTSLRSSQGHVEICRVFAFARGHCRYTAGKPPCTRKGALPSTRHRAPRPCTRRNPSVFCMSLRTTALATAEAHLSSACHCEERGGRLATWQSVLLAVAQNNKQHLRQIRSFYVFAGGICALFCAAAGLRIATSLRSSQ